MTRNQFDLEQALMSAWATADDLELLAEHTLEYADEYDVDDTVNAVLGLQRLHHMRMQKVWQIFETLLQQGAFSPSLAVPSADDADDWAAAFDSDNDALSARPSRPRNSER